MAKSSKHSKTDSCWFVDDPSSSPLPRNTLADRLIRRVTRNWVPVLLALVVVAWACAAFIAWQFDVVARFRLPSFNSLGLVFVPGVPAALFWTAVVATCIVLSCLSVPAVRRDWIHCTNKRTSLPLIGGALWICVPVAGVMTVLQVGVLCNLLLQVR